MHTRLFLALACVLVILRLPSLAQPMGADQGLYAYVGERILAGELPYRDAWDQKPPAIHYTYAALRAVWPHPSVVAAADLVVAILVAALLVALGTALAGAVTGRIAALLFLLLSDPGFQRMAGVAVRAQCETFIAAAMTGALLLLATRRPAAWKTVSAGVLLGAAFAFKYNAIVYGAALVAALWALRRLSAGALAQLAAGALVVPGILFAVFAVTGTLGDLYHATIGYNLAYSGETYRGPADFARYLVTFPIQHARVDALWLVGGAGCAVLLVAGLWRRERLIPAAWVAAACLSIAINSSRHLPQYFVQALPALALAAAWGATLLWTRRRWLNVAGLALVAVGVWRVNDFPKLADNIVFDAQALSGRMDRHEHLARYGDRDRRKYSALAMVELADFVRATTAAGDRIYVFGFSGGAYVLADRASASRFFWSRPVIVDFRSGDSRYGVDGLLADLERRPPALVALQLRDWQPDVQNSAEFFLSTPRLARWLHAGYDPADGPDGFETWIRRGVAR
ncbi:MAG TPA: hypothetical protein VM364_07620 [Vicinamibacterales bacterium]|nr:hypothetical protein [Vicinamibacterales bacterium]